MPPRLIAPEARYALSYAEALEEGLGLLPPDDGEIMRLRRNFDSWLAAEYDMTRRIILADGSETVIDERLQVLFGQLEQAGLPAGSERAQRVFD